MGIQPRKLKVFKLAQKANLETLYHSAYRILSYDIHTAPRSIGKYIDNEVAEFKWGPDFENFDQTLATAINILFIALESLMKLLNIEPDEEYQKLNEVGDLIFKDVLKNNYKFF